MGKHAQLDCHEAARLCARLQAGEPTKVVAFDFGITKNTVARYARKAGLERRWVVLSESIQEKAGAK